MEDLIKELNTIPGVEGICLFTSRGEVVDCNFESPTKEKIINAGKMILKLIVVGSAHVSDLASFSVYYENSILNARKIDSNRFIIIKHSKLTDSNLINLTIENLEHIKILNTVDESCQENKIEQQQIKPESVCNDENEEKTGNSGNSGDISLPEHLSNTLAGMQRAIVKLSGSPGNEIFRIALTKWAKAHDPSLSNINFLVDLIFEELKEQDKIEKYRKMIMPYLAYSRNHRR